MATIAPAKLGPADHGRSISFADFLASDVEPGFRYEIIDGRVYVAADPNLPHGRLDMWMYKILDRYSSLRPDVINFVYYRAVVVVPDRPAVTRPQPDVAAYHDFPLDLPIGEGRWDDVSPRLVVETLSRDSLDKDLVRNVELYWQVPSIREYWVVNGLHNPDEPSLRVYRRHGKRWRIIDVAFSETYTTKLLPGLELIVNPWA
jgi:Uma2 family endonuclease